VQALAKAGRKTRIPKTTKDNPKLLSFLMVKLYIENFKWVIVRADLKGFSDLKPILFKRR
jgi:hypothetical protein